MKEINKSEIYSRSVEIRKYFRKRANDPEIRKKGEILKKKISKISSDELNRKYTI